MSMEVKTKENSSQMSSEDCNQCHNEWSQESSNGSNDDKTKNDSNFEISSNACTKYWNYFTKDLEEEDIVMISLYNNVDNVLQSGPKCGLVALLMCQSLVLNHNSYLTQEDLFESAKQMGFSKTGEMFSVENMAKLTHRLLSVETEIKVNLNERINELVSHLAKGLPVLVPYDSDANHEPTLLGGQRAHWAIILGFCIIVNKSNINNIDLCGIRDQYNHQLYHLKPKHLLTKCVLDIIDNRKYKKILVYAKQGKSKYLHIWSFNRLCQSNCNLVKTSLKLNKSDIVLPENGGIIKGLNNQCLFVTKNAIVDSRQ
ncbi:actin maturation protease-like [Oppia nitens]|uniref:actin maturation protease-like n=1 Tax=Oppia nitens TaxID=1686743 RepID=UPI0023D9E93B|nr:actin maturation protease-like [Oppia nitens]